MLTSLMSMIDDSYHRQIFEEIYTKYSKQMFYVALKILKDSAEAEDVVHTVFLQIAGNYIEKIAEIKNPDDMRCYLLMAAKNTALNSIRKRKRLSYYDNDYPEHGNIMSDEQFVEFIETRYEYQRVLDAIKLMNDTYRDVLYLYYVSDMSYKDIAVILKRYPATVKKQITRGRKMLLDLLTGDDDNE